MHATDFVQSYFDAWNHFDPKGVADHLSIDGNYKDVPENVQRTHDELVVHLEEFFSEYPHRYELIGDVLANEDTIAYQYRMVPSGDGKSYRSSCTYHGAEFITLHDDAALTIIDYCDIPATIRASSATRQSTRRAHGRKYAKSGLDERHMLRYKHRLAEIMQSQRAYLQSDLTLPKLAISIGCSANHLSQVINAGFGMSFFDYLNQYRIEHAKELLSQADSERNAILNIAFRVGFNSNSAFYAAFKKRVGQTPSQYRKAFLNKPH